MIKEYCIIYEEKESVFKPIEGMYITSIGKYEYNVTKTITIPAILMEDAIIYATNQLEITTIKEVFELE